MRVQERWNIQMETSPSTYGKSSGVITTFDSITFAKIIQEKSSLQSVYRSTTRSPRIPDPCKVLWLMSCWAVCQVAWTCNPVFSLLESHQQLVPSLHQFHGLSGRRRVASSHSMQYLEMAGVRRIRSLLQTNCELTVDSRWAAHISLACLPLLLRSLGMIGRCLVTLRRLRRV